MTWIHCIAKHESENDLRRRPPFKSGSELQLPSALGWLSHESPEQNVYGKLGLVIRVKRNEEFFSVRAAHNTRGLIWTTLASWSLGKWCLECGGMAENSSPLSTVWTEGQGAGLHGWLNTEERSGPSPLLTWVSQRESLTHNAGFLHSHQLRHRSRLCPQVWECWVSSLACGARPPHPNSTLGSYRARSRSSSTQLGEIFYPSYSRQSGHIKYILPPHTSEPAALGKQSSFSHEAVGLIKALTCKLQ